MLIYIYLFTGIFLFASILYAKHNNPQSRRIFLFLAFVSMALVLGLRGKTVGEDTQGYINVFEKSVNVSWDDIIQGDGLRIAYYTYDYGYSETIEKGYIVLNKFIHLFTENGHIFLLVVASITCILFAKFIYDNSLDIFMSTIVFLCESIYVNAFNGVRQILAVSIAVQAYTLLKKRKIKTAIFITLLAMLIHNTAVVCFLIFPIMLIEPKKELKLFKYTIIISLIMPFAIYTMRNLVGTIFPRYFGYFTNNYWENSIGGVAILWLVEIILIIIMYWKKFKVKESYQLASITLMFLSLELTGLQITMFSRLGWFFRAYLILFFPNAMKYFSVKTRRVLKVFIIILLFILYFKYSKSQSRIYDFFW